MELSQRLDLAKLGLEGTTEAETPPEVPLGGGALAQIAGLLVQVGAVDDAEEVDDTDTLDGLGVDSLTRIELAVRAEEQFGVRVNEEVWLSFRNIGEAAAFFEEHSGE